jgi:hypothetical protein
MGKNGFALWLLIPIVLFAAFGAFAIIMTSFDGNEHMYIAASVLVAQGKVLYKDFAFVQTPYLPILYAALYRLFGVSSFYLLTSKLISCLFLAISSIAIFLMARRVLRGTAPSLSVVALFLLNMTIIDPASEVSNYIAPVAFSLVACYLFNASIEKRILPLGVALTGLLLAIAIGTKLTYATIVIPFVATILFHPLSAEPAVTAKRRITHALFPFMAGAGVGLLPILFFLSDPESFLFNNLEYHVVNAKWREITGFTGPMSLVSKLVHAGQLFVRSDNLILLAGILLGLGLSVGSIQTLRQVVRRLPAGAVLAFLLVLIAVPTALTPTPSWPQYFAMPVSFLFLILIYSFASKSGEQSRLHRRVLIVLVLAAVACNGLVVLRAMRDLTQRDKWSGLRLHDISMNVRNVLRHRGLDGRGRIATLAPLLVIESNLPIYAELATGPFVYRIGDLLSPKQRKQFVGTSPGSMNGLLDRDAPAAILVGFERGLEKPLVKYAEVNQYRKVDVPGYGGDLYVRPEGSESQALKQTAVARVGRILGSNIVSCNTGKAKINAFIKSARKLDRGEASQGFEASGDD